MRRLTLVFLIAFLVTASYIFLNHKTAVSLTPTLAERSDVTIHPQVEITDSESITTSPGFSNQTWLDHAVQNLVNSEYLVSWQANTYLEDLPAAYHATNRSQNLRSYFSSDGITILRRSDSASSWQMGLGLARFGSQDNPQPLSDAVLSIDQNRVDYLRPGITEWFSNLPSGIEHGLSIASPALGSSTSGQLILEMDISGDLTPSHSEDLSTILFSTSNGTLSLLYSQLQAFDIRRYPLPARLQLSLSQEQLVLIVDTSNAVFPVSLSYVISGLSAPEAAESLGPSYDWGTVGADESGQLGYSVSTAGDVNNDGHDDVIIGAPTWDFGHVEEGAAFLYLSDGTGLSYSYAWLFQSNQDSAHLGTAVSNAGDLNDDGYDDVVIGAIDYDNGLTDQGRVFVFYGMQDGLTDTLKTVIDGEAENAHLGEAVASAGDVDNDGYDEIIIGAPSYNDGKVYLHQGSASGVSTTPDWTAVNSNVTNLGVSVHTAGDINNDGYDDVIIGASQLSVGIGGRAYVYYGSSSGLSTTIGWTGSGSSPLGEYGTSVCTAGDVNGDGYADIIVGAPTENIEAGKAYVYYGSSSGLSQTASWTKAGGQSDALFGYSVSTAGDINGDGYDEVIIGAPNYNEAGRAFVFQGSADGLLADIYWFSESDTELANYGWSVSDAGNVNGDRTDDIIVGGPNYEVAFADQGVTFGFYGLPDATAENDSPTTFGDTTRFTATISTSGDFEYEWDFGDELTGTGQIVTHTYTAIGDYLAEVTITDESYEITSSTDVTIIDSPIQGLTAGNDSPTEFGYETTLTSSVISGSNVLYEWLFGDGLSAEPITFTSITHIYPAIDNYTATVTATNGVSTDVATTTITITEAYIAGLEAVNDSPTQVGNTTNLTATIEYGSNVTYEWDYGDGTNTTGSSVSYQYPSVGIYTATVTATNNLGTQSDTTKVTIQERIPTTLKLYPGWNLVAISIIPEISYTAFSMLDEVNLLSGGDCTEVHRWLNDAWDTYVYPGSTNNFNINIGEGYFIRCTVGADWTYYGMAMWEEVTVDLVNGWNLLSAPYPPGGITAQSILDQYNGGGNVCSEINRWYANAWDAHLDGLPFNDFLIEPDKGYFVYCSSTIE